MEHENLKIQLNHYRLSQQEYDLICQQLGRPPQGVEWALYSALWSEHCSYKTSRRHLKKFYSQSQRVVEGFGENAGVIDLGQDEKVAFKMESHNHPSFIEPYQGAATGVGGILRDIFTMGARPIALANYLCFGQPQADRMGALVDGVVRGIGGYGNCVGVPTITGQTEFNSSYDGNILVNALAVGLFAPGESVHTSQAKGVGNWVVYVGAKTGRDGVHGASMASESFDEESEAKRPTVQIGDPFFEKRLIESCLEVMKQNLVEAIQDMGAAGLTSSSFEMAAKGGVGFRLELDKVPLRDSTLTPEDILLSESQERMLLVCKPSQFEALRQVFERWDLDAAVIGEVTKDKTIHLTWRGETLTQVDPSWLVDQAPYYDRAYSPWKPLHRVDKVNAWQSEEESLGEGLLRCLKSIEGRSREWVYRQYDQRVGGQTARDASESVGVVRLPSGRALGLVLGCRPHVMRLDAEQGAKDAIAYPALELALKGFEPLAVTDCLNFGNPEKPEVMSEFVASVEGISELCEALDTPVISGNVSFYNETLDKNVTSTPSTGLVGLRDSLDHLPWSSFQNAGDKIYLIRSLQLELTGKWGELNGAPIQGRGEIEKEKVVELVSVLTSLGRCSAVTSTRLVGAFGLAYTLARMCTGGLGCEVHRRSGWSQGDDLGFSSLFTERAYEAVVAVQEKNVADFLEVWQKSASSSHLDLFELGQVGGSRLVVEGWLDEFVSDLKSAYHHPWEETFESLA